jgi:succinyl-CoA synthetase beta subunit
MEINPVIINEQGIYCADTKIILKWNQSIPSKSQEKQAKA